MSIFGNLQAHIASRTDATRCELVDLPFSGRAAEAGRLPVSLLEVEQLFSIKMIVKRASQSVQRGTAAGSGSFLGRLRLVVNLLGLFRSRVDTPLRWVWSGSHI